VSTLLAQTAPPDGTTLLWAFLLLGGTIFLIALELIVPSGGILALAAAAALIGSIVAFFAYDTTAGFIALAAVVIFGPMVAWVGWKWWSETAMAQRLVLGEDDSPIADAEGRQRLLNAIGTAETDLRPIGVVRIGEERHDAFSDHGMIPAGSEIEVIKVLDNQLRVRHAARPEETA